MTVSSDLLTPIKFGERNTGIGGSEVAKIAGISPWGRPIDVWLRKMDMAPKQETSEAMQLGLDCEVMLDEWYQRATGYTTTEHPTVRRTDRPWQVGSVDRLVVGKELGVDFKTVGLATWGQRHQWGDPGSDVVPPDVVAQCAWYMSMWDYPQWDVAALIAGRGRVLFHIHRDAKLEAALLACAKRFWMGNVLANVEPEPDDSKSYRDWMKAKYAKPERGDIIAGNGELQESAIRLERIKGAIGKLTARQTGIENNSRYGITVAHS